MPRQVLRPPLASMVLAIVLTWSAVDLRGQSGASNGEWPTYGGDLGHTRYAGLDQINAANFSSLEVAWRFKTDNLGPGPEFKFESTPLMVKGVLYSTAGSRRAVVALDASTGELLWMYSLNEGRRGEEAARRLSGRGLAYWSDGREERILYVTPGYQLIALDTKTGRPVPGFGKNGVVDLKLEDDQQIGPIAGDVSLHSTPIVARDTVIIGAAHKPGVSPKSRVNVKGYVRGFDVRTGKRLWIFHTIPEPGEYGHDTWLKDSASYTGNAGVWAQISVDEDLGLVYLPVELPTGDYYGGHRPGNGLFGESLVAVDLRTGRRRWHYQLVHHGIWDQDIPCAPILVDVVRDGRTIKAVAQPTKQNFLYVFNRETGEPIWPIEERPVAQGDVPGEWYSPTQPFPTRPRAYDRQGVTTDDLIDFTPDLREAALKIASRYKMGPLFTPPVVRRLGGPFGTLTAPASNGGSSWPGGSYDPETGILYISSNTSVGAVGIVPPNPGESDMNYIQGSPRVVTSPTGQPIAAPAGADSGSLSVQGLPLLKPPYGRISAIDLRRGEILWQIAHGETPDHIRNHPALKGLNVPRTGQPGAPGTLVTKTLLIAGEAGVHTTTTGTRGAMLRAYDKATGAEVGAVYMPAPQEGSPMTYMLNGKQYIVIAISGGGYSGELLALRLPS